MTDVELAERFGVSRRRVLEWNTRFGWAHIRIGKKVRWTEAQVADILRKHTVAGGEVKTADGRTSRSKARRSAVVF